VSATAIRSQDDDTLRRLLLCRSDDDSAAQIRLELARRAIGDGDYHRAEMQLLRAGRDRRAAEEVHGELMLLRDRCGIRTPKSYADVDCRIIGNVRVSGTLWDAADDGLCRAFGRSRRGFQTRFEEPLRVVDRGDSRKASLAFIDLDTGVCRGEFSLDARLRFPSINRQPLAGHFVPVATVDRLCGVSMLDAASGRPAWDIDLPGRDGLLPQLGPYGPSFCSVQTRRELSVVDPATGDTLWRRIELPPDRGLNSDHSAGLFGDEQTLTMLDADGASFCVYRTATGEELSRGRLAIDHRRQRKAYGRKLFFVESRQNQSVARLWDPASSGDDWSVAFSGKLLHTSTRDDLLALLFDGGRFLILDPQTVEPLIDVALGTAAVDAHTIQVFADADRFYVALYHADPTRFDEVRQANYVYDTPLTTTHVQGRLIAIDRRSEEILWSRPTEQRSILDPIEHPLPFLVAVARISDRRDGHRKTLLVEVIDKQSGCTLGMNDRLLPDQLLQVRTDSREGRIAIAGTTSTVTLDFEREVLPSAIAALPARE
jgi:PQQ-like domain